METEIGTCQHGDFVLRDGCPQCIAEARGETTDLPPGGLAEAAQAAQAEVTVVELGTDPNAWRMGEEEVRTEPPVTAVINIAPGQDVAVQKLLDEVMRVQEWAGKRVIAGSEDVKDATNDLSLMAKLKRAIEEKRKEYVGPLNEHIKAVNNSFKFLTEPLAIADKTTRDKVLAYNAEVERKRREVEEVNRQAAEVARKQAELNNGEFTVDTTPVDAPAATPDRVRTDVGMASKMTVRKWALEDITQVPAQYLVVDAAKVTKQVKAGIGEIPGIRIYEEPTLRVSAR